MLTVLNNFHKVIIIILFLSLIIIIIINFLCSFPVSLETLLTIPATACNVWPGQKGWIGY